MIRKGAGTQAIPKWADRTATDPEALFRKAPAGAGMDWWPPGQPMQFRVCVVCRKRRRMTSYRFLISVKGTRRRKCYECERDTARLREKKRRAGPPTRPIARDQEVYTRRRTDELMTAQGLDPDTADLDALAAISLQVRLEWDHYVGKQLAARGADLRRTNPRLPGER